MSPSGASIAAKPFPPAVPLKIDKSFPQTTIRVYNDGMKARKPIEVPDMFELVG